MRRHYLWMIIGCVLPLLLIFILPALGIGGGGSLVILVILMFACHLFMMRGHDKEKHGEHTEKNEEHRDHSDKKEAGHGCH